jgi:hypothetical protein
LNAGQGKPAYVSRYDHEAAIAAGGCGFEKKMFQ